MLCDVDSASQQCDKYQIFIEVWKNGAALINNQENKS